MKPENRPTDADVNRHLPLKPVEFLVLAILQNAPLHGYGLVQEITRRTDGRVKIRPGDLYRVLYRMERRELLESAERREAPDLQDERRAYYQITELGHRVVRAEAELMSSIAADVMATRRRGPHSPHSQEATS